MKFIITGALGHLGSQLIRELPLSFPNCQMVLIDNLSSNHYCSLFNLPHNASYHFIEDDVNEAHLDEVIKHADVIIHLARNKSASIDPEEQDHIETANFIMTEKIAHYCSSLHIPFIHLSTTDVYGTHVKIIDEYCKPQDLNPQTAMAKNKLQEETCLQTLSTKNPLKFISLRIAPLFGVTPGMNFTSIISKLCWQAVLNQPLTIERTTYKQKSPYLAVHDAINAICMMIKRNHFDNKIYNVVSVNTTMEEIIESIRNYIPAIQTIFFDEPRNRFYSGEVKPERLLSLGFTPVVDVKQGIYDTINLLSQANSDKAL